MDSRLESLENYKKRVVAKAREATLKFAPLPVLKLRGDFSTWRVYIQEWEPVFIRGEGKLEYALVVSFTDGLKDLENVYWWVDLNRKDQERIKRRMEAVNIAE